MRSLTLLSVFLLAQVTSAQATDTSRREPGGTTISGVVRDSVAGTPLAGATVQLVAADNPARLGRTATSDSLGRFALNDVPNGRYTLGFFHPMLDSLGIEPTLREVVIDGQRAVRADLAIPSAARLRTAICGSQSAANSGAVVIGIVRDAHEDTPVARAKVTAEWLELSVGREGIVRRLAHLAATTGDNGWFAICGLPSAGTVALRASRGADSTDMVEGQIPAEGFLRSELYLGAATTMVVTEDKPRQPDAPAPPPRKTRTGKGRVSGTVIAAVGGRPLAGALVGIADGPQSRTNERGEWTIVDAPAGTRMVEAHAVGYFPARRRVDIIADAPPTRFSLSTFKAVLDTVRITASRQPFGPDGGAFQRRRRMGIGHFITAADITRIPAVVTSDLFRRIAGVRVEGGQIMMHGAFEPWCSPSIFINSHYMRDATATEIDDLNPDEVAGIEVYTETTTPAEFQVGLMGCGSIVIWTK